MAIALEDKKAIVAEVNETATNALSLVIADARGVSVDGMTALRKEARENKVTLRVVRNTLAKRAFEGTEYECVTDALVGPSLFGFSMEDPGACARLPRTFQGQQIRFQQSLLESLEFGVIEFSSNVLAVCQRKAPPASTPTFHSSPSPRALRVP